MARQINPSLRYTDFSLPLFAGRLFENFPDTDNLNFVLIQRRAVDEAGLDFFSGLSSFRQAVSLRKEMGRLSPVHARIVLLFIFSGLRWRISRIPLKTCPFCPRFELLWSHFFECECLLPYLSAEFLGKELFMRYVRAGRWRHGVTCFQLLARWSASGHLV